MSSTPSNNPFRQPQTNTGSTSRPSVFGSNQKSQPAAQSPLRRTAPLGAITVQWAVRPLQEWAVRFDLNGLGDPFHRLLGTPFDAKYGDLNEVIQALRDDGERRLLLEQRLDEAWEALDFRGSALLYPWRDEVRRMFGALRTLPAPTQQADDSSNDQELNDDAEDNMVLAAPAKPPRCLRAIDVALVLNVLARSRSIVLVAGTPLALEAGFLERAFLTDDLRLVALVRATGYIEEAH